MKITAEQFVESLARMSDAEKQKAAKSMWNDMYLKSETLEAMESVSGLLNLKFKKGDLVDLIIYIGNIEFIFEWNPEDSEF